MTNKGPLAQRSLAKTVKVKIRFRVRFKISFLRLIRSMESVQIVKEETYVSVGVVYMTVIFFLTTLVVAQ